ncbi:hypothetical protein K1719_009032 [Acacia pycnantha]|nr:hypothetical protein K1719_009032 [Acacia pycnantha]
MKFENDVPLLNYEPPYFSSRSTRIVCNGQNQHVPDDEIAPFHLYNNGTMVEFSSIPALNGIRFAVHKIWVETPEKYKQPTGYVHGTGRSQKSTKASLVPAIVIPGSITLVLLFILSFYIYRYLKKKGEDQERLEKFMEDYKAMKPTRFSYADLKRITNHFKDKIGEGAHGTVFKVHFKKGLTTFTKSTVSMTAARGTLGYIAPEVFSRNFGKVSYKSDIYSYGMLLLEMVGGRKNVDTNRETFQVLYPGWIHNLLEGRDTNVYIEDDDDDRIAKKLAIVGLWCIQWHPISRPSMKMVIQMLEGEVDKLELPPTPFDNATSINSSTIVPTRHLNSELEVIPESE